jgi:hypothetical protein
MKRGIIVAVTAISVAGAASTNLFTTPAPARGPAALATGPQADFGARAAPVSASRPVEKVSVEVRQAPVPMQPRQRAPVASASDNPNEFYAKAQALVALPSDRWGETAARAAIEADGYKGVQALRRGDNGVWHAKAIPWQDRGPAHRGCPRRRNGGLGVSSLLRIDSDARPIQTKEAPVAAHYSSRVCVMISKPALPFASVYCGLVQVRILSTTFIVARRSAPIHDGAALES